MDPVPAQPTEDAIHAAKEKKFEQLLKDSQPLEDPSMFQKLKSMSLENLNQAIAPPDQFQYFCLIQMCDGESQTEGIHDDNLTLLEYLTKYYQSEEKAKVNEAVQDVPSDVIKTAEESETREVESVERNQRERNQEELSTTPSLSDVLKPAEQQKSHEPEPLPKSTSRAPVRANYSLRNQTINSKNSRVSVESTARKSSTGTRPTPRTSASAKNIPPTSVLNRQKVRSKTMIEIPKCQQRFSLRSGELRKKSSLEDNTADSSTSTLKASTNELYDSISNINRGSGDIKKAAAKKPESKPVNQAAGDGWMTVKKNKRRSSWSSQRFDQPSASASLPTLLALLNENGDESDKESSAPAKVDPKKISPMLNSVKPVEQKKESSNKVTVIKTPTQKQPKPAVASVGNKKPAIAVKAKVNSNVPSKRVNVNDKIPKVQPKQNQQNFIKRQKSDITGLNLKSLHKEYLRREKLAPAKKKKERNEEKVDMNLQTSTLLISQTIDNLYSELGGKKSKFQNGNLSSCDELEDDVESDDDHQKKLVEEQESLERQIRELESAEIDMDTETDETDCEAILCDLEDESSENNESDGRKSHSSFINEDMTLEMRYAPMLADLTQMERAETLATLQELVARDPGRAQKLHQKLSSPSRRRSFHETLKKYQAKQTRAQEKRSELQQQQALKLQHLIQRVEQVKAAKFQLTETRRLKMEEKLQRATENRENYLKNKIKKAHDEEEKMKEIAFIKSIEMQNKRLDLLESSKEHEGRLRDLEQERLEVNLKLFSFQ